METYNHISSAIFDVLMAPFGHDHPAFDLLVWPLVMGIAALQVYKYVSNQDAIARVKGQISMRLLEIRLFSHDIGQVLKSTGSILVKNAIYIGHNLLPLAVMIVPMVALMVQLVAHYAYEPSPVGAVEMLHVKLDPATGPSPPAVKLTLPEGVSLDAPMVRTEDGQVYWRLRADQPGDHVLQLAVGDQRFDKHWAVGGPPRKIPVKRLRGLEAALYPGEEALASTAPILSIELAPHTRPLAWFPDGEFGILMWAMVFSLVAGFALKGFFGVTI
jgi:hypothetical protein